MASLLLIGSFSLVPALLGGAPSGSGSPTASAPTVSLAGWRVEGEQGGARLGSSLAAADVNGDGFGDLIVGAPGFDGAAPNDGRVSVYLGSSGGLANVPDWMGHGIQRGAHFGAHVAAAGDVNGDGFDDIVVSAPDFDRLGASSKAAATGSLDHHEHYTSDEGAFFVFHGSPTGLSAAPQRIVVGIERGEHFGSAVAGAGDVNGDGFDDLLVGATGKLDGLGAMFLFTGSPTGTQSLPAWMRIGTQMDVGLGSALAGAGDVNSDGFDDFVGVETSGPVCGRLLLFHGSAQGPGANPNASFSEGRVIPGPTANFDQTGGPELFYARATNCSASASAQLAWRRLGAGNTGTFNTFGPVAALAAGDVNADGWVDFIASVPSFANGPMHGRVYVYLNRSGATFTPVGAYPYYDGDQVGGDWGAALAVTDVDGDGAAEVFVGAPGENAGDGNEGLVVLHPGWHQEIGFVQTNAFAGEQTIVAEDFDDDGESDLVSRLGEAVRVRYGSPVGLSSAFQTLTLPTFAFHNELFFHASTGDVNGDGRDDVLVIRYQTGDQLYLGTSTGITSVPVQTLPVEDTYLSDSVNFGGSRHRAVHACDLDGDAFGDVLISRLENLFVVSLHLFHGSGVGLVNETTFEPEELLNSYYWGAAFLDVTDLDFDGAPDLLMEIEGMPTVYRGTPQGFERAPQWYEPGATSLSYWLNSPLAKQDFDGDGFDDLLLNNQHLHRGTATGFEREPCWFGSLGFPWPGYQRGGDFDGDGRPSFTFSAAGGLTVLEATP
jgi:FG-GAP repeat protein/VCBS repeat protein